MRSDSSKPLFRLGLIVNPWAGIGGPQGLKGSDGYAAEQARAAGAAQRAVARMRRALAGLSAFQERLLCLGFSGAMGEESAVGLQFEVVGSAASEPSTADDTVRAARQLLEEKCDLILFAGGDGTARDIFRAVGDSQPVLGVPAGVKMHSGVYAVSPESAAEIVAAMVRGDWVDVAREEVRDIDEDAFREGRVSTRYYGELLVPRVGRFLQATKVSGREVEELVVADIAAEVVELMDDNTLYIIGPGTTTAGIMAELGLDNTLLGIDAVQGGQLLGNDLNAASLEALCEAHDGDVVIIVTPIGRQGHILGRGNQQITPQVIRRAGPQNLWVVATKTKLNELESRPLLVDSNERDLDLSLEGYIRVITGYQDSVLYRVSASGA